MKYLCECLYCGHKWWQVFYAKPDRLMCDKKGCGGRQIALTPAKDVDNDPFGYNK